MQAAGVEPFTRSNVANTESPIGVIGPWGNRLLRENSLRLWIVWRHEDVTVDVAETPWLKLKPIRTDRRSAGTSRIDLAGVGNLPSRDLRA